LESGLVPDGVLAANDPAALSAYRALHQAGLSVPDDVKLVGFDDIHLAAQSDPSLTTIRVEKLELGRLGATKLLDLLAGAPTAARPVLPTTLVTRDSA